MSVHAVGMVTGCPQATGTAADQFGTTTPPFPLTLDLVGKSTMSVYEDTIIWGIWERNKSKSQIFMRFRFLTLKIVMLENINSAYRSVGVE